jgi:hypothetical protein
MKRRRRQFIAFGHETNPSLAATLSHIASRDMLSPQNGALKTV